MPSRSSQVYKDRVKSRTTTCSSVMLTNSKAWIPMHISQFTITPISSIVPFPSNVLVSWWMSPKVSRSLIQSICRSESTSQHPRAKPSITLSCFRWVWSRNLYKQIVTCWIRAHGIQATRRKQRSSCCPLPARLHYLNQPRFVRTRSMYNGLWMN